MHRIGASLIEPDQSVQRNESPTSSIHGARIRRQVTGYQLGKLSPRGNGRSRSKRPAMAAKHAPTMNAAAEPPTIQSTPAPVLAAKAITPIATS